MSLPVVEETAKSKPKREWISHNDFYDGEFLRGWYYAVHRVHTTALGISLIHSEVEGVTGYNGLVEEKKFMLSSGSLIFSSPLATSDWLAALKTDLKAVKILRGSKGKSGYALVTLYRLNDSKTGLAVERDVETTQGAVIAHLRDGSPFPEPIENQQLFDRQIELSSAT